MQYKFCLLPYEDSEKATTLGYAYIKEHMSDLVSMDEIIDYLAAGYTQGVDFVVYNGKAYMLKKTYILVEEKMVVHLAVESIRGCDVVN